MQSRQMPLINEGWLDPLNQVALYRKIMQVLEWFKGEQVN